MLHSFRAWDTHHCEFKQSDCFAFGADDNIKWAKAESEQFMLADGRYIYEQCIGIPDKHGKDIYENDFVRMHYTSIGMDGTENDHEIIGVAQKDEYGVYVAWNKGRYYWIQFLDKEDPSDDLEVLGNIHEGFTHNIYT